MRDLLDVIEGNLGGFPYIRAELLDFLPEGLEVWLLLVEQYLDFALSLADAFVVLSRGSVIEAGRTESSSRELLSRHIAI